MKILCLAKSDYSGLTEGMARAFTGLGHHVDFFDLRPFRRVEKYVGPGFTAFRLRRRLTAFAPDLVFVVAPLFVRSALYEPLVDYRRSSGSLLVGWIGDLVTDNDDNRRRLATFDRLYYTDSGFAERLSAWSATYLPLATDPALFQPPAATPHRECVFVASRTANRVAFLQSVRQSVEIFGPGWVSADVTNHRCHPGKQSLSATGRIYGEARMVLNLKNADNVVHGLNQRSFDPCACRVPLLHDAVADLERHFEPEREVLVFATPEEFDEQSRRLHGDVALRQRIANAGYRRVLACHTFRHRAQTVLADLGQGEVSQ
ncbi:MAG: hypothetical protein A2091_02575 [Desulfuromonadales bacterium GWD2_61_12]|nr:MAG: hypothetical protein A2005_03930 [Desulfuromonadales bacterium GWC2_61_20]OGR35391.1 MAG: hypothetical protein A2091_02575 [Desulfuromonadales bacterium GWD2_61_12]HAD03647.1 hypothetical protein [Desulfuromonas sp.]HBT83912.1 hypothetical protein [Desulfuromonas sp.]